MELEIVEREDTAQEVGSGSLLFYATPCMVALMEGAACEAIANATPEGKTSVGIELNMIDQNEKQIIAISRSIKSINKQTHYQKINYSGCSTNN